MIQAHPDSPRPPPDRPAASEPYPDVRSAFFLTLLAMLAAAVVGVFFLGLGTLAAVGIGQALGVGGVATWAARRVPEPQAEHLGLRPLDVRALPIVLCLAPAILLASELDNLAGDGSREKESRGATYLESEVVADEDLDRPRPQATLDEQSSNEAPPVPSPALDADVGDGMEPGSVAPEATASEDEEEVPPLVDPKDTWSLLQAFVIFVGIAPVVEEFLFRGVIQQGLVARLGLARGVGLVALLWALLRPAPVDDLASFVAAGLSFVALGWLLGIVRIATGSILGSITLASIWAAIGLGSLALQDRIELPGMNVEGTHLPWTVTLASLFVVVWAASTLYREAVESSG
ncbi:MAG: CPBP family intramembrane metalloprotease [Deltaproteobacteria bacterium]|jgi:membrane protease YdiL (CAAX protease family)|nr:CPBP family intramembrane metalloprotease [Deltaproteobacteria bacterium]